MGSNFFANNHGVQWFIDNVLSHIDNVLFTIVGKDMDTVFKSRNKIQVRGFVLDLSEYYYSADAVVVPVFHGGGMKTKTAEAMMYGCPVIGTTEDFEGYDIDFERIGGLANTVEETIERISRIRDAEFAERCCGYARSVFLEKYSFKTTVDIIRKNLG